MKDRHPGFPPAAVVSACEGFSAVGAHGVVGVVREMGHTSEIDVPDPSRGSALPEVTGGRWSSLFLRSRQPHAQRFVIVCGLVLLLIALLTTLPESPAGRSTTTVVAGSALMASAWASRVRPQFLRMLGVLVASIVALSIASMIAGVGSATTANALMMLLLLTGMPVAILAGVRGASTVNVQTVFAAISLYLLIGLVFAFLITAAGRVTAGPYFSQGTDGTMSERVYFSYITMGTLGYGDLTPAGDVGRLLAIFETVSGSLFLVTAVSVVVTRVGTDRRQSGPRGDAPTGGA